jgi:hypothetical protein
VNAHIALGLALAIASAVAINSGYYVQHGAAAELPPLTLRRPLHSLALLFRNLRWLVGFVAGIGGWVLYVIALKLAPLSIVQAAAAGGIAFLAVLVGRLSRRELGGVIVSVCGLVLLGLSLIHTSAPSGRGSWTAVALWIAISLAVAAFAAGPLARVLAGGAGLGIAAGVLYAAGDVGTKAAVSGGARLAFVPALLACHGLAFVALQLGFQRGSALATAGLASLWTNALPIVAGTLLFSESLPAGARGVARVAAFVCVLIGAVALARPEAASRSDSPERERSLAGDYT